MGFGMAARGLPAAAAFAGKARESVALISLLLLPQCPLFDRDQHRSLGGGGILIVEEIVRAGLLVKNMLLPRGGDVFSMQGGYYADARFSAGIGQYRQILGERMCVEGILDGVDIAKKLFLPRGVDVFDGHAG